MDGDRKLFLDLKWSSCRGSLKALELLLSFENGVFEKLKSHVAF